MSFQVNNQIFLNSLSLNSSWMKECDSSRLYRLFLELKDRKLVDSQRKLVTGRFVFEMQGTFFKRIRYNEKFYCNFLNELDDDTLRFVLLHEEGHLKIGSRLPHLAFLIAGVVFIFLFDYPYNFGLLYFILSCMIVFPLLYRILYLKLYNEELKADIFAAERMRDEFHIIRPSNLLRQLFSKANEKWRIHKPTLFSKIILSSLILIGFFPDYHPARSSRIMNVEENVDSAK